MHLPKTDWWKIGIIIGGVVSLLVLTVWVPALAANAQEGGSSSTASAMVTVEATPTEDATVTALNKEKLLHDNDWWWNSGATILTSLVSTLGLAGAGVFTVVRYFSDRKDARDKQDAEQQAERKKEVDEANRLAEDRKTEREKQAQERFQAAVTVLGEEK